MPSNRYAWLLGSVVSAVALGLGAGVIWFHVTKLAPDDRAPLNSSEIRGQVMRLPPGTTMHSDPLPVTSSAERTAAKVAAFLATLDNKTNTPEEAAAFDRFVRSLSVRELSWLLQQLDSAVPETCHEEMLRALLGRVTEIDPSAAVTLAQAFDTGDSASPALRLVLEKWLQQNPKSAVAWLLQSADPALQNRMAPLAAAALERASPAAAADFISALPAGETQTQLLDDLIGRWGATDFSSALAWAREQPVGAETERALIHLSYRWVEEDPAGAVAFARHLASHNTQLLATMAGHWAARDPYAAAQWARQLPGDDTKTAVLAGLAAVWAQRTPYAAALFAASLPGGTAQDEAMIAVMSGWARQDPRSAVAWATAQFPPGRRQNEAYTQVLFAWGQNDAAGAGEWIAALPAGAGRDAAFISFSGSIADQYPEAALAFAESIDNESQRLARIESVARRWLAADPQTATIALAQSSVPPALVSRLLSALPARRGTTGWTNR